MKRETELRMIPHPSFEGIWRRVHGKLWRVKVIDKAGGVHFIGKFKSARHAAYARANGLGSVERIVHRKRSKSTKGE
jgi:hypothetical protein